MYLLYSRRLNVREYTFARAAKIAWDTFPSRFMIILANVCLDSEIIPPLSLA